MIEHHDLEGLLRDYLSPNSSRILLISPFITNSALESILPGDSSSNVTIITSWRADHLQSGVSNIELFQLAKERNWTLFINDRIHLKIYSNDYSDCWIGSANTTKKALQDFKNSNIEALFKIDNMEQVDCLFIEGIILNSTLVTEEIYEKYKQWLMTIDIQKHDEINGPQNIDLAENDFLITKLPAVWSPTRLWELSKGIEEADPEWKEEAAIIHDLALYKVDLDLEKHKFLRRVKKEFFKHPFIEYFCQQIDERGMSFGRSKEWLQNNCTTIPTPYRRDLTEIVQCLFNWIIELDSNRYELIQPNISQIIRLK